MADLLSDLLTTPTNNVEEETTVPGGLSDLLSGTPVQPTLPNRTPEEEGKIRTLSDLIGQPRDVVEANQEGVEKNLRQQDVEFELDDAPVSKAWLQDPNNAVLAQGSEEELGFFERVARGFQRGTVQTEFGQAQFQTIFDRDPAKQARADELNQKLQSLGEDSGEGFASYLASAAEVVGQMLETFNSPEAVERVAIGAGVGGAAGLAGGPLAPATVTAGVGVGLTVGVTTNLIVESFENEAAFAHRDYLDAGMSHETAAMAATAVGVVNASLEMVSITVIAAPFAKAGKVLIKQKIRERLTTPENIKLGVQFFKQYSAGIIAEVGTEILQELTAIAGQEIIAMYDEGVEGLSSEEIAEKLAAIAEKTFKAMVVLAPIGPGANYVAQKSEARQIKRDREKLDQLNQLALESTVAEMHSESFADHAGDSLIAGEQEQFFIDADQLQNWARQTNQPNILRELEVDSQMADAMVRGDAVTISAKKFSQHILRNENYDTIVDHVRTRRDGMSTVEAEEFEQLNITDEDLNTAILPEEESTVEEEVTKFDRNTPLPDTLQHMEFHQVNNLEEADVFGGPPTFLLDDGSFIGSTRTDVPSHQDLAQDLGFDLEEPGIVAPAKGFLQQNNALRMRVDEVGMNVSFLEGTIPSQKQLRSISRLVRSGPLQRNVVWEVFNSEGKTVLSGEDFRSFRDHVNSLAPSAEATVPTQIAEQELGLQAFFRTADEAGTILFLFKRRVMMLLYVCKISN
jgi:hypothetical protein